MAPYVMQLLRKRKEQQETERVIAGEGWDNYSNLVFTNALGGHLVHVSVYKDFKDIATSLGLEGARFHDLRHSYSGHLRPCVPENAAAIGGTHE